MIISDTITSSFQTIWSHKLRSSLTLIGIVIGVAAVVTMFSSVNGIKQLIEDNMENMGWNNSIIVYPSDGYQSREVSLRGRRFMRMSREIKPLSFDDYQVLRNTLEEYRFMYGSISLWDRYYGQNTQKWTRITATNQDFFHAKNYPLLYGRYFNHFEENNAVKVCILGYHFANENFPGRNPIGQTVSLGQHRYRVIGVLGEDVLNSQLGFNFNAWERRRELSAVYIPLSTGALYLREFNAIDQIYVQAIDGSGFNHMKNRTRQILLTNHNMSHGFSFADVGATMAQISEEMDAMMTRWNIALSAIASISLLVGGIGLFSTLLISINQRMTEIGIRKSVGATEVNIFVYFITEAIVLATLGALAGIFFSTGLIKTVSLTLNFNIPVVTTGVILGLSFAFAIGLISGIYPAVKASKVNPISAIFYFD